MNPSPASPRLRRSGHTAPRSQDRFLLRKALFSDVNFLAPNRYRNIVVPLNPKVRFDILVGVVEIEIANALRDAQPSRWLWGALAPEEFLLIVSDVTRWSLMHFEPDRS